MKNQPMQQYPIMGTNYFSPENAEANMAFLDELYNYVDNNKAGEAIELLMNDQTLANNPRDFTVAKQNLIAYIEDFEDGDDVYMWDDGGNQIDKRTGRIIPKGKKK